MSVVGAQRKAICFRPGRVHGSGRESLVFRHGSRLVSGGGRQWRAERRLVELYKPLREWNTAIAGSAPGPEPAATEQLGLESGEESPGHGVVVGFADEPVGARPLP